MGGERWKIEWKIGRENWREDANDRYRIGEGEKGRENVKRVGEKNTWLGEVMKM